MRRFYLTVLLSIFLVCSFVYLKPNVKAVPRTIEVPVDFPTIQAAINNSTDGDTVFVYNGTYYENVVVNKSISLVGQDENITIIEGGGSGTVIQVTANNVSIANFTVRNSGFAAGISVNSNYVMIERSTILNNHFGIYLMNAREVTVGNCNVSANYVGLHLESSKSNIVKGNNVTRNDNAGLELSYCSHNIIENNSIGENGVCGIRLQQSDGNWLNGNLVVNHESGVVLDYSGNNTLRNNAIASSRYNFAVEALYLDEFLQDIDFSNTVNGKPICYLVNQKDILVNSSYVDAGYVALVNSSNIRVEGLKLSGNGEGVLIVYTRNSVVEKNVIGDNGESVLLYHSINCSVNNNTILNCAEGLLVSFSAGCSLSYNEVAENERFGVQILSSQDTDIIDNNITANGHWGVYSVGSSGLRIIENNITFNGAGLLLDLSDGCRITGNVIFGNERYGVFLTSSRQCVIQDNDVINNLGCGMFVLHSVSSVINANNLVDNYEEGLYLHECDFNQISENLFEGNSVGVRIYYSGNCTFNDNYVTGNLMMGVRFYYSPNGKALGNSIVGNGLEGLGFLYSGNSSVEKNVFSENLHYGAWLLNSNDVFVHNNKAMSNGWDGIFLQYSNSCVITYNSVNGNAEAGIGLLYSNQSVMVGNEVTGNKDGLRIFASDNNTISSNTAGINTRYGFYLYLSSNNRVFHNNFFNNIQNVRVLEAFENIWDKGYPSGGNFWSDYAGEDFYWGPCQNLTGSDGLGDTPYTIDDENQDRYPLMTSVRTHDITVIDVNLYSHVVYVGWMVEVNVSMRNVGNFLESFNVTAFCNNTVMGTYTVSNLPVGGVLTITFLRNATGYAYGNYTISAVADYVLGETNTDDNILVDGIIFVTIPGDVDGDGDVDLYDVVKMGVVYGSRIGDPGFGANMDINADRKIDIYDMVIACTHYGQKQP